MKISKRIIITMSLICTFFFGFAIYLEFGDLENLSYDFLQNHIEFYINICIGIFASGILVVMPSIVQYYTEKKRYYVNIYRIINSLLSEALGIIKCMEENSQDNSIYSGFENYGLVFRELIAEYSTFSYFIKYSSKDKLIDSIISESVRFFKTQGVLLKYSKQFKSGDLKEFEYKKCFNIIKNEMIKNYKKEFSEYQTKLENDIMNLIKNKEIKKYY